VSEATRFRHCTCTVQSQEGKVRNVKQVIFEPGPKDSHGRCGGNVFRQIVPAQAAATGKARSPTVDNRVLLTISDKDKLEHRPSR